MRSQLTRVSRLVPVPPHQFNDLANQGTRGWKAARPPSPLPGHPLPTTGLGGRKVATDRGVNGSTDSDEEGGAEPAADRQGSGTVWVFGCVSVSDERTD